MYSIALLQNNELLPLPVPAPSKIDESVPFDLEQAMDNVEKERNGAGSVVFKHQVFLNN